MLLIEAELRQSEIHGIGLFCVEPIAKGTRVWQFHPLFDLTFKDSDYQALPKPVHSFMRKYGYRSLETDEVIVNLDLSRHMNHSDNPNLSSDQDSNYFAAYDLPAGTELTCDYRAFSASGCSDFLDIEQKPQGWQTPR